MLHTIFCAEPRQNASVYLPSSLGGMGLKSLRHETEIQYVRKGLYLRCHPDLATSLKKYQRLQRTDWRNPLTDCQFILEKYDIILPDKTEEESITTFCRKIVNLLAERQLHKIKSRWSGSMPRSMHYGRLVLENQDVLKFPALKSLNIEDWTTRLIRSAAKEQVHELGSNLAARKRCRLRYNAYENSYHVISAM